MTRQRMQEGRKNIAARIPKVAGLSWPIVVSMLSFTAMELADTLFVGWLGTAELAAVGLATTATMLINGFFMGTLQGVSVVASQATGANLKERALQSASAGVLLAIPFGLLVVGLSLLDVWIFQALGGEAHVQAMAREYFGIRALGAGLWYVMLALSNYYQGVGDTRTPMKINIAANVVNVVLDPILIFGVGPIPAMGIEGAAIATVIAQGIGLVAVLAHFVSKSGLVRRVPAEVVRSIARLGLPMGVHYVLGIGAFTLFTALLARMGTVELAAHQIALKVVSVSFLPGKGIGQAATILAGQHVGARAYSEVATSYKAALALTWLLMGLFGLSFWLFHDSIAGVFTSDMATVALAGKLLMVAAVFQLFDATVIVTAGTLNGTGDTRFTMLAGIAGAWFMLVPFAYLFGYVLDWGAVGAWMGMVVEMLMLSIVLALRFWREGWKQALLRPAERREPRSAEAA
ncbi:hypothetical protein DL240_11115 [Lujinxingia litoralis]|uniref:Multidrug-efflux transporter n=1 Tax=Lujinxingia litoralis TaxID=2211119 RepID=A0A328C6F9_9DELT|nr:MATE family efflux transporter [Lujinxingia litoralis]RAL22392.1 hypothetical protein DL240_11115 [Lujinxingia litoralis]